MESHRHAIHMIHEAQPTKPGHFLLFLKVNNFICILTMNITQKQATNSTSNRYKKAADDAGKLLTYIMTPGIIQLIAVNNDTANTPARKYLKCNKNKHWQTDADHIQFKSLQRTNIN
jgi:hypothetical protein